MRAEDLTPIGRIDLGDDADNVRVDRPRNRVIVGYGNGALAVIDPESRTKVADIRLKGHPESFQIDEEGAREAHRILVVFRGPARLLVLSTTENALIADLDTCGDADDVFVDPKRHRAYVSCGAGQVDVFEQHEGSYQRTGNVGTSPGARTSLFVPELDRLFVAARAAGPEPAAIWVFRPTP
jgi:hypothetical protein